MYWTLGGTPMPEMSKFAKESPESETTPPNFPTAVGAKRITIVVFPFESR